jgi:hypothetical protein
MGANEPAAPASLLQVGGAGRVVGKKSLKLWERLWEPKIATLVNVHERRSLVRPVAKARHFSTIEKNSRVEVSLLSQHRNPERAKL